MKRRALLLLGAFVLVGGAGAQVRGIEDTDVAPAKQASAPKKSGEQIELETQMRKMQKAQMEANLKKMAEMSAVQKVVYFRQKLSLSLMKERKLSAKESEERLSVACGKSSFGIKDLSVSDARAQFVDALVKSEKITVELASNQLDVVCGNKNGASPAFGQGESEAASQGTGD